MKEIGRRLQKIRKELKISQVDFAKQLDTTRPSISRYENSDRLLPTEILIRLYHMGININWILSGNGKMFLKNDPNSENYNKIINEKNDLNEENNELKNEIKEMKEKLLEKYQEIDDLKKKL